MATKYLSNYYSYKVVPQVLGFQVTEVDPKLALEKQVQGHLANGHRYFFQDEFQNALSEYQTAYSLLHKFLHPYFPVDVTAIATSVLKQMQLTDVMVSAAAQVARYRSAVADRPIVSPGSPPQEISSIVQKFGGTGSTVVASPAAILYEQASTYLQAGATAEARPIIRQALELNGGRDRELESNLMVASGIAAVQQSEFDNARDSFAKAFQLAQRTGAGIEPANIPGVPGAGGCSRSTWRSCRRGRTIAANSGTRGNQQQPRGRGGLDRGCAQLRRCFPGGGGLRSLVVRADAFATAQPWYGYRNAEADGQRGTRLHP